MDTLAQQLDTLLQHYEPTPDGRRVLAGLVRKTTWYGVAVKNPHGKVQVYLTAAISEALHKMKAGKPSKASVPI